MATQASLDRIQQLYIAYYGRPADPVGHDYWAGRLDESGGDLTEIIDAFGTSGEFTERYGAFNNEDLIINIYSQAFARDADSEGLSFYLDRLNTNVATLASIALQILDGAINDDADVIGNKLLVANAFTTQVASSNTDYSSNADAEAARAILGMVTENENTVSTQIDAGNQLIEDIGPIDVVAPTLSSSSPADNSVAVAIDGNIVLTFSEAIRAGTGAIVIVDENDASDTRTIPITDAQISISGSSLTFDPFTDWENSTDYIVQIESTAIEDIKGNGFAGIQDDNTLNFTTVGVVDTTAPELFSTFPADNAAGVGSNENIIFTFDESIQAGNGNIVIKDASDNSGTRSIDINDAQISFSDNTMTLNPSADFEFSTNYVVQFPSGVIEDLAGNPFAGISNTTTFNFSIGIMPDVISPTLSTLFPVDGAMGVATGSLITLTFDEAVQAGTGSIVITDGSDTRSVDIGDAQVTIAANVVTINLSTDLDFSSNYSVQLASGVIEDLAGNSFSGILDTTTMNFRTVAPPFMAIVNPASNLTLSNGPTGAVVVDLTQANAANVVSDNASAVTLTETQAWNQISITTVTASAMGGASGLALIIQQSDAGDLATFIAPAAGTSILALKDAGDYSAQSIANFDEVTL
ncbi:MAG: methionine-rich copper-binding protein CopC, partial [Gammaproteobacteria bacterium]